MFYNEYLSKFIESGILRNDIFTSWRTYVFGEILKKLRDKNLMITENYTASGHVENKIARTINESVLSQFDIAKKDLIEGKKQISQMNTTILDKIIVNYSGGASKTITFWNDSDLAHLEEFTNTDRYIYRSRTMNTHHILAIYKQRFVDLNRL